MATVGVVGVLGGAAHANVPANEDGLVAFQRNDDAHGEIWVADPAQAAPESTAVKVSGDAAPEARPAYGPTVDGEQWLLASQRLVSGSWDIWRRIARGKPGEPPTFGAAAPLVTAPGDQEAPVYSRVVSLVQVPLLAYTSTQTGRRELWLQDATGASVPLTSDGAGYANPDFAGRYRAIDLDEDGSTDRERIGLAFESTRGGRRAIWAMDIEINPDDGRYLATRDFRPVASGPEELFEPSWQVTNDFDFADPSIALGANSRVNDLMFTTRQSGTDYLDYVEEPWALGTDGSVDPAVPFAASTVARHQLTGDPGGDDSAVWAPNGDQVAFQRTVDGNSDVWLMLANGTDLRRMTSSSAFEGRPSWQPGQESSVDKVGGHTNPGPTSRTPRSGTSERRRASPGLAIRRARWHGRRVRVSGRAARGLSHRLRVSFTCGRRSRHRTARRIGTRSGAFGARLVVSRACRRAGRGAVGVAYRGDDRHTPQRVSRSVRRR